MKNSQIKEIKKHANYSNKTGRMLCKCGKGYASEDVNKHFGLCKICYSYSLTRKELNQLGLKRL